MNRPNIDDLKPSRRPDSRTSVTGSTAFRECEILCYRFIAANPGETIEAKNAARLIADLIAELARAWGAD